MVMVVMVMVVMVMVVMVMVMVVMVMAMVVNRHTAVGDGGQRQTADGGQAADR